MAHERSDPAQHNAFLASCEETRWSARMAQEHALALQSISVANRLEAADLRASSRLLLAGSLPLRTEEAS